MSAQSNPAVLVGLLIPGDGDFPSADTIHIQDAVAAHARFGGVLKEIEQALPDGFSDMPPQTQIEVLHRIEVAQSDLFQRVITAVYSLYYTHPKVAAAIEAMSGHTVRPPQPMGHDLPPFDPALVAVPAQRGPLYRPTPKDSHDP